MALRTLIATDECIQEYERATREHQDAGLVLLADGYAQGAALMALSAEMVLKSAYFRFVGYTSSQQIGRADLRAAETDIRALGVLDSLEGYHNLLFWANAIVLARQRGIPSKTRGGASIWPAIGAAPMNAREEAELLTRAARLRTNWSIGDRYKAVQPYAAKQDLEDVFDDAVRIIEFYDSGRI